MEELIVAIEYSQIEVFEAGTNLALDWTDQHVAQGFRAGEKQISFGVPDHDGECTLQIQTQSVSEADFDGSERLIRVPFSSGRTSIGIRTVTEELPVRVGGGDYDVYFGLWPITDAEGDEAFRIKIGFATRRGVEPSVMRSSREMETNPVVRMD